MPAGVTSVRTADPSRLHRIDWRASTARINQGTLFGSGLNLPRFVLHAGYAGALTAGSGNTYRIGGGGGTLSLNTRSRRRATACSGLGDQQQRGGGERRRPMAVAL